MKISLMMMFISFWPNAMKTEADWTHQVKGELKRRNVSYQGLSDSLKAMGIGESPENIANKISRGKFSVVFLIKCLEAIGCKVVRLGDV